MTVATDNQTVSDMGADGTLHTYYFKNSTNGAVHKVFVDGFEKAQLDFSHHSGRNEQVQTYAELNTDNEQEIPTSNSGFSKVNF